jgi:hypothetical protein
MVASLGAAVLSLARKRPEANFARLVEDAYVRGADTIHLGERARYRVDGGLVPGLRLSRRAIAGVARHLRRLPPVVDFRGSRGFELELRIGEDVIALGVRSSITLGLDVLDLWPETAERLARVARERRALVLVAGAGQSGRTLAARAILAELDGERTRTAERENLEGWEALDADALLVERLRDARTADLALEAALEGRLVVATTVACDASGAEARLRGLAAAPLIPGLALVLAQRLVPRRCRTCTAGCERCKGTGRKGRVALQELLVREGSGLRLAWSFAEDARWKIERGLTDESACA